MNETADKSDSPSRVQNEREFDGPVWKHPYFVYVWLSLIPFLLLLVAAWFAIHQGWLPNVGS